MLSNRNEAWTKGIFVVFTLLAVVNLLLTMLEHTPPSEHHFLPHKPDGSTYTARGTSASFGATLEGLQCTAYLVTYTMVF